MEDTPSLNPATVLLFPRHRSQAAPGPRNFPGRSPDHVQAAPRRLVFAIPLALLVALLAFNWAVRAATDPARPSPRPANPGVEPPNAYAAPHGIAGPTTPFHDSVAARYNYAFGKDTPFLPSTPPPPTASSSAPRASTPRSIAAIATRKPTTSGVNRSTPTASAPRGTSRTSTRSSTRRACSTRAIARAATIPWRCSRGDLSQGMPKKRPFEAGRRDLLGLPLHRHPPTPPEPAVT